MPTPLFSGPGGESRLLCLCAPATEPLCAEELGALAGVRDISQQRGAVAFRGTREALYRANLYLRTPSRILCPLSDGPCRGTGELYDQVRALPWEHYLRPRGTLAVSAHGELPGLTNSMFTAQRVKDAIVDRFRARAGVRPDVDPEDPDLLVNVQLYRQDGAPRCAIALDSSGAPLHRRGYRQPGAPAPLKETLAAAILLLAGYGGGTLLDPCCGSGTLLLEGGLLALGRAPGLQRNFGFMRWLDFDRALWQRLRAEAAAAARPAEAPFLHGSDIDRKAIAAAARAAEAADLAAAARFRPLDLREAAPPRGAPPGLVVCNPPYGERLGEEEALRPLYRALGDTLKRRFTGYRACVFTANLRLGREIGLRPKRRHVLYNGGLEGRLLCFDLY